MREIKFRAWNKKSCFMDSAWLIDWEHGHVCHSKHNQSTLEDCVLMQYTGLKDKNGVEIYEGDILRDHSGVGEVEWMQESCQFVIFARVPESVYIGFESDGNLKHTEVIGNIYENPELLEVSHE